MVRLFREEISPRTEILLDASLSMRAGGEMKPRLARQLAALLALLSGRLGGRPSIIPLEDGPPAPLGLNSLERLATVPFAGRTTMAELLNDHRVPLKRQAVRIVISDFLFPHDPASLIRRLATDSSSLWLVQVLSGWEASPTPQGGRRLVDIETDDQTDLVVDRAAIESYRARLGALQQELVRNCRRAHATFVSLVADRGLPALCRDDLCAAGLLRIA